MTYITMQTEAYLAQQAQWPQTGKHILAHFDEESVTVYQAYRPEIGKFAVAHQYFGGEFSLSRTSWIKPNFLWMMYRSSWGTSPGQEVILAVTLKRTSFETILTHAVHSSYQPGVYANQADWQERLKQSEVVMQWDPDHDPTARKVERRAIQLGLRGETLKKYSQEWIVNIEDISAFVQEQRAFATPEKYDHLLMPREREYVFLDSSVADRFSRLL